MSRETTEAKNRRFRATLGGFFAACLVLGFVSTRAYADVGVGLEQWTDATYAFTFLVTDLTPNLGVHWYLFAELFSHFRGFFLFVFHAFPAFLSVPALARYGHARPILAVGVVLALHTALGPYPTWGNVAGYLAFAPIFTHGEQDAGGARAGGERAKTAPRVGFAASAALAVTATLTPIFWHLWIEARVANANFLFAVTWHTSPRRARSRLVDRRRRRAATRRRRRRRKKKKRRIATRRSRATRRRTAIQTETARRASRPTHRRAGSRDEGGDERETV